MSNCEQVHFDDAETLAQAAASQWLRELQLLDGRKTPYCVALSGGRIARNFFSAVAAQARSGAVALDMVHFFWADERCVPPTDPDSNFGLAHQYLFVPLGIAGDRIHRVRGELQPEIAAAEAGAELRQIAPASAAGQPVLDMVFLGMGEDGHVASLFPGETPQAMASPAVFRAVSAPKPLPHRVTLGYPALAAARQVWVLASGPDKKSALRQSLSPQGQTPLARVLGLRSRTRVLTDIL